MHYLFLCLQTKQITIANIIPITDPNEKYNGMLFVNIPRNAPIPAPYAKYIANLLNSSSDKYIILFFHSILIFLLTGFYIIIIIYNSYQIITK